MTIHPDADASVPAAPPALHPDADVPVAVLRQASFGYDGAVVVDSLDFTLRAGESVALLGPNGCGKSTLVKGLLGLAPQMGGEVEVFGRPLVGLRRRSKIGYVPQRHTVSGSVVATVEEIVMIGRLPQLGPRRRPGARDRRIVADCLEEVGLGGRARDNVSFLSGGQQRRVLVARALAAEPKIMIMDEPTAGVDESNQVVLAGTMSRLKERGVALLTVTHELEALASAIDRVVHLSGGRIVSDQPATALVDGHVPGCTGHCEHCAPEPARSASGVQLRDLSLEGAVDA